MQSDYELILNEMYQEAGDATLAAKVSVQRLDGSTMYPQQFRVGILRLGFQDNRLVRIWIREKNGTERQLKVEQPKENLGD